MPQHGRVPMTVGGAHRTLRELVADAIRAKILSGDLAPGERLYEDRLAEELGVSRNPVRESIRALEATGLIEVLPRRGAYVVDVDPIDLAQLLAVRAVLEAHAAGQAAMRRTDEDLAELDRCLEQGLAASTKDDLISAAECHRDFHIAIEKASGNPYIGTTANPLRQRTELVFSMLADSRSMLSWEEHQRLRDAIAAGDASSAESHARAHMASVIDDLTALSRPA
jgi:DNA-binding GntR family transcriptional regulator